MPRTLIIALILVAGSALPATADDRESARPDASPTHSATDPRSVAPAADWFVPRVDRGPSRGAVLPSLYVSLAALNAFDAYATTTAVADGRAREANPLLRGAAGKPAVMWAVKGSATGATIFLAERLWRKNRRVEAIAVMLISNGMMSAVAARNAAVLHAAR
jgi:hypothetical protein